MCSMVVDIRGVKIPKSFGVIRKRCWRRELLDNIRDKAIWINFWDSLKLFLQRVHDEGQTVEISELWLKQISDISKSTG
uniref:Uncharacterized protein n=1 Tax=Lutzomyia longipalpis TaxID=7200 RepID=A0A1B0CMI8_LUTLO